MCITGNVDETEEKRTKGRNQNKNALQLNSSRHCCEIEEMRCFQAFYNYAKISNMHKFIRGLTFIITQYMHCTHSHAHKHLIMALDGTKSQTLLCTHGIDNNVLTIHHSSFKFPFFNGFHGTISSSLYCLMYFIATKYLKQKKINKNTFNQFVWFAKQDEGKRKTINTISMQILLPK